MLNDEYLDALLKRGPMWHESSRKAAPADKNKKKKNVKFTTAEKEKEKSEKKIPPNKKYAEKGLQLRAEPIDHELQSLRDEKPAAESLQIQVESMNHELQSLRDKICSFKFESMNHEL